ncbi:EAL domain-containing protein [Catenuloplanes atrovinosus]|uniref:EAL domain-containing protein (Putative c-di-GMP-specific phosphodiesterase class I)/PAS domain-containing protein/GGDEF domain-containing protein n=1 Tax=Catenuloplanes atrovinosus TaxID=137266 RepID=A0AAE3YRN7_9ACTN|nr:EAL domain-containing protein [Catenuloplanes atrovinosus]MDR7277397.1 EAL domain-containing protein (putative c-di-GMP-specific phosphodiesterase class I)/PAS domain-containing protein/GGDEF domain-containing protein [Catenuloplanes atrovinosus]
MRLDDVLRLASGHRPSPLEQMRFRRVARQVLLDHRRQAAAPPPDEAELTDPLTAPEDELARITRAACLAGLGVVAWDRGTGALTWSAAMTEILGRPAATADPLTLTALMACAHPEDLVTITAAVQDAWTETRPAEVTFRARRPDGTVRYVHALIEILADGIVATCEDVTGPELARRERARQAVREEMLCADLGAREAATGLPAREYLIDEVDRARRTADGVVFVVSAEPAPVTLRDGDRDDLAAQVGRLLTAVNPVRAMHGLAAPGLFGVLLRGTTTAAEAERVAVTAVERVRSHLFSLRGAAVRVNAWAGAVRFARGAEASGFELLLDAEHAAREARRGGHLARIAPGPARGDIRLRRSRSAVQRAVANERFALFAQPILDLDLNRVTRHEILLRVRGESGEPVPPWAFLDTAERIGEILPVDRWVIDHAIKLIGQGALDSHCQINVSGRSLADPGLLDHVTRALTRHRVRAGRLTFEITETAAIENRNEALAFATGIRQLGAQLALDDFGTGHASLLHLRTLPVDLVKIDGRFITGLARTPADQALVERLTLICHDLGIRVAAESVPDDETAALLRRYDVDFAQGFHIGRPVPMADPGGQIELDLRPISKLG